VRLDRGPPPPGRPGHPGTPPGRLHDGSRRSRGALSCHHPATRRHPCPPRVPAADRCDHPAGHRSGHRDSGPSTLWLPVALHRSGRWRINWQCLRRSAAQIGVDPREDGMGRDHRHDCPICRTCFRLGATLGTTRARHFNSTGHRNHVVARCADAFTATGVPIHSPLPRETQCLPATQ
jgi:hypothetical protein